MTISSTLNRITFACNGITVTFPITYPFFAQADLVVLETVITTGAQTTKTLNSDYTITGTTDAAGHYPNGGNVVAAVAPAGTVAWTVYRDPATTQLVSLTEGGQLPVKASIEAPLDYVTMLEQRSRDLVSRSLTQPDGDSATITRLPAKVIRASSFLAFDANGNPISAPGTSSTLSPVSAYILTLLDDVDAATARGTLGFPAVAAAGDLAVGSAAGVLSSLPVGAAGTIPMVRTASTVKLAYVPALAWVINSLTYSPGTDAVNDWNIAVGGAMDATGAYWMTSSVVRGKQVDVTWAVGGTTGAPVGGLDTGAVGNNDYHIWMIARSDTGVVDFLFSLSPTAPAMPANYDFKRLMGWFTRVAGTNVACHTYETAGGGLDLQWDTPTLDINLANTLTSTRRTDVVKVPKTFSVIAHLNVVIQDATVNFSVWITCPDQTDVAPSATVAPLSNIVNQSAVTASAQMRIRTSATGTIAARSDTAAVDLYAVSTMGFTWARRN
jgi:hypothetical protein